MALCLAGVQLENLQFRGANEQRAMPRHVFLALIVPGKADVPEAKKTIFYANNGCFHARVINCTLLSVGRSANQRRYSVSWKRPGTSAEEQRWIRSIGPSGDHVRFDEGP